MIELKFEENSARMDLENNGFLSEESEIKESSIEDAKKNQFSMNIHNQFPVIFKNSFEKMIKKPDIKNFERLFEVFRFFSFLLFFPVFLSKISKNRNLLSL